MIKGFGFRYFLKLMTLILFLFGMSGYTTAEKISNKEIRDILYALDKRISKLEVGQEALHQRIDNMNQRIDDMNRRIDDLALGLNKRIDDLSARMNTQFVVMIMLIVTLFGYIIWDRKTVLKPILSKIESIETELGMKEEKGSKVRRLIEVLKELAKDNPKLAEVLRNFHLL